MSPRTLIASLALPGLLALPAGYSSLTRLALGDVEVAAPTCDTSPSAQAPPRLAWHHATLELTVEHPANCAASLQRASVQRLGTHLFVRTRYQQPEDMATGCNCLHRAQLRIPGLPQQAYSVHAYSWP